MTPNEFRRRALEAQRQAGLTADPLLKAGFQKIAQEWFAIAERTEWLEQRYGSRVAADLAEDRSISAEHAPRDTGEPSPDNGQQ